MSGAIALKCKPHYVYFCAEQRTVLKCYHSTSECDMQQAFNHIKRKRTR